MFRLKVTTYKIILFVLLRLPDAFFALLFKIAFPIYKALHTKRAYGRASVAWPPYRRFCTGGIASANKASGTSATRSWKNRRSINSSYRASHPFPGNSAQSYGSDSADCAPPVSSV